MSAAAGSPAPALSLRQELAHDAWPAADRAAWAALFAAGDVFTDAGPARHWRPATRTANRRHYARWLGWLARSGALEAEDGLRASPGARATPEAVRAFAAALQARVAPQSVATILTGLRVVLTAMDPDRDWRWFAALTNRLHAAAEPSVDRGARLRPIEEIHAAALRELERLQGDDGAPPLPSRRDLSSARVAWRDALIVLLLSAAPIRRGNLAGIEIGRHLVRAGDGFRLRFAAEETKGRQPLRYDLPAAVTPHLVRYLDEVRPGFAPAADCRALWLTADGRALSAQSVYDRVVRATARLLGAPINPHAFRACAATSFALRSPALARQAAPLLGHRSFRTTEAHYILADQLDASRRIHAVLGELRKRRK